MDPGDGRPRPILWLKIADPAVPLPEIPPGADIRVLLPADDRCTALAEALEAGGAQVRRVPFLLETEFVHDPGPGTPTPLVAQSEPCALVRGGRRGMVRSSGAAARAARDAFALLWHTHAPGIEPRPPTPVADILPTDWARFVAHPTLNPAQAEVIPAVLGSDRNLVVVAPTGAGKTIIGMAATLKAMLHQGRRAVWLVPQRSLTDELDRELDAWRRQGVPVERLSGEHAIDVERLRHARLWVATTEKFEAVSRTSSLRDAIDAVGCVVVDEIHLLGDDARGSTLEALLARIRDIGSSVRVVGLSATVSNADEIADWLRAALIQVSWRASQLSWQLPMITGHADWNVTDATRTRLAAAITHQVAGTGGSVLVFCGSKRNVRRTALVIAAGRGASVTGVHPDDVQRVHDTCAAAGIGLHYKGWDHRHDAERAFRERRFDVLVATPTVAAGVNLPARAVVVRDTQVGLGTFDVAIVQQMFGRAGRVGTGEREGAAFLITDQDERAQWQARLVAGNRVRSQIHASLPDHLLGEMVRGTVRTIGEAEQWWVQTLAFHQGNRSLDALHAAVRFLDDAGLVEREPQNDDDKGALTATDLGSLTARLMVPSTIGHALRVAVGALATPTDADHAEEILIDILAIHVPKLAQASVGDDGKAAVTNLVAARGRVLHGDGGRHDDGSAAPEQAADPQRGDLARAALLTAANSPEMFGRSTRDIAGVPAAAIYPVLEEAPRYLHWLASQGLLGTVHPWIAIVAADLGRRIRWRRCQPRRGAGRLLWMCEQMATASHLPELVPRMWEAATARGYPAPDWRPGPRPALCELDDAGYQELLRERACNVSITTDDARVVAEGPASSVLVVWNGNETGYHLRPLRRGTAQVPAALTAGGGTAVFTWRGDHKATGWLARYAGVSGRRPGAGLVDRVSGPDRGQ
ncbi:DEAD/DEAH box helicase [Plantactinospora sp. S1510]|uniref:DEAD/DEAH box helicase n=1 Tax=Plantactinospora alkalitolerans TaxID=2789879 RepID=A0ABS0H7F3_9ACTN|nr:DEAD/DEAH box helicase [Plantactinospora alkalitolerans]MBF9134385.1 DEAD/DEAH box helicase [Plantactinospora alkalitolerans]